jgi:hypothetical protein
MHRKLIAFGSMLLLAGALSLPALAQENAGDKRLDREAAANSKSEPHMAAALEHLRQAEDALKQANSEHGGHRVAALKHVQQAESEVTAGIQYFNAHEGNNNKKKK